jgi:hypothetical protein
MDEVIGLFPIPFMRAPGALTRGIVRLAENPALWLTIEP